MVDLHIIKCKKCDGMMSVKEIKRTNPVIVGVLITIGVLVSLTVIGAIIGVPLVIFALKLGSQSDSYWVCDKCKDKIKRIA